MAVTYKELSLVAELHYSRLPDAFKLKAGEFFDSLDLDGDGSVTLPELLNSNLEGKFGQEFIQDVFYSLDMEGKGHLNFRESLTLYYLCMYSGRLCEGDGCGRHIPHGLGYTCLKCWKEGVSSVDGQAFCLCLDCYSSLNYQHQHDPLLLRHDFVLFDNLLNNKPTSPTAPIRAVEQTVKQCIVCGDYHESGARGFTCDVHMSKMRDSTEFVCEWCFSYLCSKCGNLFRDSTTRAEPGKWLQKFVCPSCHQKKITTECYDASVRRLRRVLGGTELLRHCRTCEIKHKNGTLFWIVNGTNMAASSSATSATAQQPRASATINARSRNTSFDNQPQVNPATSGSGYVGGGVGNGSAFRGGISSRGGRGNPMNVQEGNDSSSRGRGFASRGGRGSSQMYFQDDEGNMALGGGGFINRSSFQEVGAGDLSRSSSGGSSTSGPISLNKANLQETAVAAVRTVNRMMNVANRAANMLNAGLGGAGGGGGGGAGSGAGGGEDGGSGVFGGIFGSDDGGSGEGMFASIGTLVGGIVTEEEYPS